jgi:hypothetical protein
MANVRAKSLSTRVYTPRSNIGNQMGRDFARAPDVRIAPLKRNYKKPALQKSLLGGFTTSFFDTGLTDRS